MDPKLMVLAVAVVLIIAVCAYSRISAERCFLGEDSTSTVSRVDALANLRELPILGKCPLPESRRLSRRSRCYRPVRRE